MPSTRDTRPRATTSRGEARIVSAAFARIHAVIRRIPRGCVMTYGEVAAAAGMPRAARIVGYALRAAPSRLPWQRVLGKRRRGVAQVAIKDPVGGAMQRSLLEDEGVRFSRTGGVDLGEFGVGLAAKAGKEETKKAGAGRRRSATRGGGGS